MDQALQKPGVASATIDSGARLRKVRCARGEEEVIARLLPAPDRRTLSLLMEKPIVFLSHSSRDKVPLAALKELLDRRAAGSLEFFLSSDGQSIRLGSNWVVRISDALEQAKVMFLFLSAQSADSKWIHFEAGSAYSNDIQVVPVCLPGMDLNRVSAPLNLLQGFNLHSADALGNLARTCNEVFQLRIDERFTKDDFNAIFTDAAAAEESFFGAWTFAIEDVYITTDPLPVLAEAEDRGLPRLAELAKAAGLDVGFPTEKNLLDLPGCRVEIVGNMVKNETDGTEKLSRYFSCVCSANLMHLTVPVLDRWLDEFAPERKSDMMVVLKDNYIGEEERHNLTAQLFKTGIHFATGDDLEYEGITFRIENRGWCRILLAYPGRITGKPVGALLARLFQAQVLFIAPAGKKE